MARINNMGERGSPCLTPLQCRILLSGYPFKRKEEEEDPHRE
jgi:hypothetical protein